MTRTPNRDRAAAMLARLRPPVRPAGSRWANTFRLDLRGRILSWGQREEGICADAVIAGLDKNINADRVLVNIESEGGSVRAAQEIYSALRNHPGHKIVNATGICASAATLILMSGDFRTADLRTRFLIHEPERCPDKGERWTAAKHARIADQIKACTEALAKIYAERTGKNVEIFKREMQNENDMDLAKAKRLGLIHCLAGEESWRNGRPYYFDGHESDMLVRAMNALSPGELQTMVRKGPASWSGTPLAHLAFATPARNTGR